VLTAAAVATAAVIGTAVVGTAVAAAAVWCPSRRLCSRSHPSMYTPPPRPKASRQGGASDGWRCTQARGNHDWVARTLPSDGVSASNPRGWGCP